MRRLLEGGVKKRKYGIQYRYANRTLKLVKAEASYAQSMKLSLVVFGILVNGI